MGVTAYPWAQLQPRPGWCGPAALRHALYCHGVRASVGRLALLSGCVRKGESDEGDLAVAAGAYGFALQHLCRNASPLARAALMGRAPALVCVDRWDHWVTVVATSSRYVTYLDSERPGPVERQDTWLEFLGRARGRQLEARWDFYPVVRR